jgi:hypothetical protein
VGRLVGLGVGWGVGWMVGWGVGFKVGLDDVGDVGLSVPGEDVGARHNPPGGGALPGLYEHVLPPFHMQYPLARHCSLHVYPQKGRHWHPPMPLAHVLPTQPVWCGGSVS